MQNKDLDNSTIAGGMRKACLLALLLSQPGFAQATDVVQPADSPLPATQSTENPSPPPSETDTEKKIKPSTKRPPVTRFTPTEKLRADDAVAFPVDI